MKLQVEDLSFSYGVTKIIEDISLHVEKGEFIGLIGPNGSGKSTILKNVYRALKPDSGTVFLDGEHLYKMNLKKIARKIGVVGQENEVPFDFKVDEMVAMGRSPYKKLFDGDTKEDKERIAIALTQIGMQSMGKKSYSHLSGGEKQRVLLARVLTQNTDLYEDDYAKIPELTYGSATREAVLTSGADFIYGIDWEFGGEGLDIEELKDYGITTYMNSATTLEEIYKEIEDIGKIFNIEDKSKAFIADQMERISAVQEKISGQDTVKVLVYDSGGDGVFTAGKNNFETLLIEHAGGKNIFDDITDKQWVTVSYEEVISRQPDVIIIHDYDAPSVEQKIEEIKNDPFLSELKSVKDENFLIISLESVLPGNRMAYTVETMAKGFYPGLFE